MPRLPGLHNLLPLNAEDETEAVGHWEERSLTQTPVAEFSAALFSLLVMPAGRLTKQVSPPAQLPKTLCWPPQASPERVRSKITWHVNGGQCSPTVIHNYEHGPQSHMHHTIINQYLRLLRNSNKHHSHPDEAHRMHSFVCKSPNCFHTVECNNILADVLGPAQIHPNIFHFSRWLHNLHLERRLTKGWI